LIEDVAVDVEAVFVALYRGVEADFLAKFGKETIAGTYWRPKLVLYCSARADLGRAQETQALLRYVQVCSSSDQVCSPSA
jgi:hypothetical protein